MLLHVTWGKERDNALNRLDSWLEKHFPEAAKARSQEREEKKEKEEGLHVRNQKML